MKNKHILFIAIIFLSLICGNTYGQKNKSITVHSFIKSEDGKPVPQAQVTGNEGAIEVVANADGEFSISVAPGSDIIVEAAGYEPRIISLSELSEVITLTKSPFLLSGQDDIHIAYGKIKKRETVNALSAINPEGILKVDNAQSVSQLLSGRITSLSNVNNLRGMGNALVIIDGVPRDMSWLLPEEIEQITVLKDVNASVLYGTEANNGVILITTKRGKAFKRKMNFSLDRGISKPVILPKYLGSADYMRLYNEALVNDGLSPSYTDELISNYENGNPYRYPNVDYYSNEFLKNNRPFTRFVSEFSGGNRVTQYYANLGWVNSGSLLKLGEGADAGSNRLSVRSNVNVQINDFIKTYIDGVIIFDINKQPNGNFWDMSSTLHPYYFSPLIPVSMVQDFPQLETAKIVLGEYILGGTEQYQDNVYGNMFLSGYNQTLTRTVSFNNGVEVNLGSITEGLVFKTQISVDMYNDFQQSVNNVYAIYRPTWAAGDEDTITALTKIGKDETSGVQRLNTADFQRRTGFHAILDYNRTFMDKHSLSGTLLGYYSRLKSNAADLGLFGNMPDQKPSHLGLRIKYDFAKKYFADFSSAYVHSVKLPAGNRESLSPSLGLGWVLSEEDFLADASVIDYLKLRISAGILNTDVNHSGQRLYESNIYNSTFFNWADGLRQSQSRIVSGQLNPDLTFEKVKTVNFGLEGYFFKQSLNIDVNVFFTENSGIVTQRTTYPAFFASYLPYENYNSNTYSGAELGINWAKTFGDFSINLGGNILYAESKIKVRDEIWQESYQYREGYPVSARFGLEALGFFSSPEDISSSPFQEFGEVRPGDIKYKDQNDDGRINDIDMVYLGDTQEKISYGTYITLKYKSISLFAMGNGISGGENMYSGNYYWIDGNDKYTEEVLNRWTPATASTATYPRLTSLSSANNYRTSTFWLYNRAFFRVNRVQVTYEFPKNVCSKLGSKGLNLYLRGSNLLLLAEDGNKRDIRIGQDPAYKSYAVGLKLLF